ncbi:rhodanese-like domain-containing protein [Oleidesulfovibrio sp.]|uniref:rhodanese-like domain-containing protein n=1 Tax=Oleidesulfovibrio sp. TaxID=2909707 RepID=UPI003A868365
MFSSVRRARTITPYDLRTLINRKNEAEYLIVDVRHEAEFRQGHIPGAVLIPVAELESRLHDLDPEREYVFYCHSGGRSTAAALLAEESGLLRGQLYNLSGGIMAWEGLAVADVPRIAVFEGVSSIAELLLRAIDMEKAAYLLYSRVREAASRETVCSLMDTLVNMEEAHARVVYSYLKKQMPDVKPFTELFDELSGNVLEGGLSVEELDPWIRGASTGDCMEIADLALEVESNALDLYRTLAFEAARAAIRRNSAFISDADGKPKKELKDEPAMFGTGIDLAEAVDAFTDLAQQEKQHTRIILQHMDVFQKD